jgi:hypothetical protein
MFVPAEVFATAGRPLGRYVQRQRPARTTVQDLQGRTHIVHDASTRRTGTGDARLAARAQSNAIERVGGDARRRGIGWYLWRTTNRRR